MGRVEKVITVNQIRKIHVLARERGMDDELLHAYIQTLTKKESLKLLTVSEGIRVIDTLEGKAEELKGQAKASWLIEALKSMSERADAGNIEGAACSSGRGGI